MDNKQEIIFHIIVKIQYNKKNYCGKQLYDFLCITPNLIYCDLNHH